MPNTPVATQTTVRQAYEKAAIACLRCGKSMDGANALKRAQYPGLAARLLEAVTRVETSKHVGPDATDYTVAPTDGLKENFRRAARLYLQASMRKDAARCFERAGDFVSAIQLLRSSRLYEQVLGVIEHRTQYLKERKEQRDEAALESLSNFSESANVRETVFLAARHRARDLDRKGCISLLENLPYADRITFFESENGFLEELCDVLCE